MSFILSVPPPVDDHLPAGLLRCADAALYALHQLSDANRLQALSGQQLLEQRSRYMGFAPAGQRSANGSCHLWQTRDQQWLALNLSRPQDWELLPALFQQPLAFITAQTVVLQTTAAQEKILQEIRVLVQQQDAETLLVQGRSLGLAIAIANAAVPADHPSPWHHAVLGGLSRQADNPAPRVLDLSALWAGPLCSHLLQLCGAQVTKVESLQRPDGARINIQPGAQAFYQQLNQHKQWLALDFHSSAGQQQLQRLIAEADIVIESARPRALRQLGIHAEQVVAEQAGKIWVSITGYGRSEPEANWIAYGDDAAINAGLFALVNDRPTFIGDAIADPLTGMYAALAAYTFWKQGKATLLDINLHGVARYGAHQAAGFSLWKH